MLEEILCVRILTILTAIIFIAIFFTLVVGGLAFRIVVKVGASRIWIPLTVTPHVSSAFIDLWLLLSRWLLHDRDGDRLGLYRLGYYHGSGASGYNWLSSGLRL